MAGPLILVVFVAAGELDGEAARSMTRAARQALGSETRVELRTGDSPSDADVTAAERQTHADAVIALSWVDPKHRQGKLRMHVARTDRWIDRTIGFGATDADLERGRTLGFAAASITQSADGKASTSLAERTSP